MQEQNRFKLNKSPGAPSYQHQVWKHMLGRIENGEFNYNEALPSIHKLRECYGVSPITIRSVHKLLMEENRIEYRRGKGMFLVEPKIDMVEIITLKSFTETVLEQHMKPSSKLLEPISTVSFQNNPSIETKSARDNLQLSPEEPLIKIKRLRFMNESPVTVQTVYMPYSFCPEIINENLESDSLYWLLENKYKKNIHHGKHIITTKKISEENAKYLNLDSDLVVYHFERITYEVDKDKPFEYMTDIRDTAIPIEIKIVRREQKEHLNKKIDRKPI